MLIAWHPKRWQKFYMLKDDRIEIEPIFLGNAFNVYIMEVLEHFGTTKLFVKT